MVGIAGGYISGVLLLGVNSGIFFARIYSSLSMPDISQCFIKALVFAAIVATISCYQGYFTHMKKEGFGAKGVSLATTSAVVISSVVVLCADYVITSVLM
jgi:phospholipid/cholesterol/gamma-HCH transport system permease protein